MEEDKIYNEKKNTSKKLLITIALVVVTVVLGIGGVYAYFAATVSQDTTSNVSITAVSGLAISFSHSPNLEIENALPGQSWTKTFSATLTNNTSEIGITYSIKLHVIENTFGQEEGYLTYTLTGTDTTSETEIKLLTEGDIPIFENKNIKGNKTTNEVMHTYILTISYPNNSNSVQTQGGVFNGYVYFETGTNKIYDNLKYMNHEGTVQKARTNLEIGDLVTIGTEAFYVLGNADGSIEDENGKIRALAKYNLLVGRVCTAGNNESCSDADKEDVLGTYGTYGMQSSKTIGNTGTSRVGTTEYGNVQYGNNIYNGSIIERYVNAYVSLLKSIIGIDHDISGRLILKNDLQELKRYYTGAVEATISGDVFWLTEWYQETTDLEKPTWLWSTNYWTGSYRGQGYGVYRVYSNGYVLDNARGYK